MDCNSYRPNLANASPFARERECHQNGKYCTYNLHFTKTERRAVHVPRIFYLFIYLRAFTGYCKLEQHSTKPLSSKLLA